MMILFRKKKNDMKKENIEILNLKVTIRKDNLEVITNYSSAFEGQNENKLKKLIDNFRDGLTEIMEREEK